MQGFLSISERINIILECAKGHSYPSIAKKINFHKSGSSKVKVHQINHIFLKFLKSGTVLNKNETHKLISRKQKAMLDVNNILDLVELEPQKSIRQISIETGNLRK